jgi:hypothetical protein
MAGSLNTTDPEGRKPPSFVVGFYEKVIKVKADVAALLIFDFRHISTEKFALGSLRSDDWQLGRPTGSPFCLSSRENLLVLFRAA